MFKVKSCLCGLAVLALVNSLAYSAPAAGKVRSALGVVDRQKIRESQWNALRVNARVYQSDKVRTGEASEVIFALPDGSSITIAENAEVELSNLLTPNEKGGFETRLDIKKGHVNFAVQKQKKNSNFRFKTGTATASIRGTEGYVGGEGVFFAGLKTGKLEIVPEGQDTPVSIVAGETTFGKDSLVVLKLSSSGHPRFAKKLQTLLADSTQNMETLIGEVQKADSLFQQELKAEADSVSAALPENGFNLTTSSPFDVCMQGLVVEGFYRTQDSNATLTVKVGNGYESSNLIKFADGAIHSFSQKIAISDENELWTASEAVVSFAGAGISDSKKVEMNVNKSCEDVNRIAPAVMVTSYDSLRCSANISIGDMQNDAGIFAMEVDGAPMSEEAVTRNSQKRVKLSKGHHEYVLRVEDQAGNKTEISRDMGCYPMKRFNINVMGPAKKRVTAPPGVVNGSNILMETLMFKIKSPENNPEFLYKVVVKQNGKIILQEVLSQIQSLDYQIPIELVPHTVNRIDIEVTHKSGFRAKAKKVYEVSPK